MIVMVDKEEITGSLNPPSPAQARLALRSRDLGRDPWPLRAAGVGATSAKFTTAKLYADYLRREGNAPTEAEAERRRSLASERSVRDREEWVRGGQARSIGGQSFSRNLSQSQSRSASVRRGNARDV